MADLLSMLSAAAGSSGGGPNPNAWDISKSFYDAGADAGNLSKARATGANASSGGGNEVMAVYIRPDGEKIYALMNSDDTIRQASLTTAWVIGTYSLDGKTYNVGGFDATPSGLFFKPDGTKMYVLGTASDKIHEFDLGTAWDITTSVFNQDKDLSVQDSAPSGLFFKDDGTKMYFTGFSGDKVYEYDLSTPWDVSTLSFVQDFSVSSQDTTPNGVSFLGDGTKMYVSGIVNNSIYEYSLSTPWDISTASYVQSFSLSGLTSSPGDIFFKPDGTLFFVGDQGSTAIYSFSIGGFSVASQDTTPVDVQFKPDGTKMYVLGNGNDSVYEYDLSVAWGITTASYLQSFSVAAQDSSPQSLFFKPDGTAMYVLGATNDNVYQYSLSTAWDVTSASYVQAFLVSPQDNSPLGLFIREDGEKMYLSGNINDSIFEYDIGTPWDISTATYVQSFSIAAQCTQPRNAQFKTDGTEMYVIDVAPPRINQYSLSTPWDISTASFTQFAPLIEQNPLGWYFRNNGEEFWTANSGQDRVFKYSISST